MLVNLHVGMFQDREVDGTGKILRIAVSGLSAYDPDSWNV